MVVPSFGHFLDWDCKWGGREFSLEMKEFFTDK